MSNFQHVLVNQPQTVLSNQCLTGRIYHVVQTTGLPGTNVLKLIPVLKSKDNQKNLNSVVQSNVIPNTSTLNVPQRIGVSHSSAVSNVSLSCPVSVPVLQQAGAGKCIIATQGNLTNNSSTLCVSNTFPTSRNTPVILEKSTLNFAPISHSGNQTFIVMNTNANKVPGKTPPMLPLGHRLQIPAHAEVKTVPASSLPISIQQKILPLTGSSDVTKIPSVIYVSPVNTVKTANNQAPVQCLGPSGSNASPITSSLTSLPALGQNNLISPIKSQTGPMKWVVQENVESSACLIPVRSSSDTASKIIQILSGTKTEDSNVTNPAGSKSVQIKDNALVMCNNKIFLLTKKATDLENKNEEAPASGKDSKPTKDASNKMVEVVLSKNKPPTSNQKSAPESERLAQPNVGSTVNNRPISVPLQTNPKESDIIYIDDDDDDDVISKPQNTTTDSTKANTANKVSQESSSVEKKNELSKVQAKTYVPHGMKTTSIPITNKMADQSLRRKFGLRKKEKIILKRIPLLGAERASKSKSLSTSDAQNSICSSTGEPLKVQVESPYLMKRKSAEAHTMKDLKRWKSLEESDLNLSNHPMMPSSLGSTMNSSVYAGSSAVQSMEAAATSGRKRHNAELIPANSSKETPDGFSSHISQDITGHFSEVSLPSPRFHGDSLSAYLDETAKDEKIQRLKEVLKEREQALEALRRQKKT